ncbi:unnamed protein product [Amoebophrya sp. A120]|nr:unnamed protein product [Amoebophrya sp. A120]|eukprot:GSA120T00008263001.1
MKRSRLVAARRSVVGSSRSSTTRRAALETPRPVPHLPPHSSVYPSGRAVTGVRQEVQDQQEQDLRCRSNSHDITQPPTSVVPRDQPDRSTHLNIQHDLHPSQHRRHLRHRPLLGPPRLPAHVMALQTVGDGKKLSHILKQNSVLFDANDWELAKFQIDVHLDSMDGKDLCRTITALALADDEEVRDEHHVQEVEEQPQELVSTMTKSKSSSPVVLPDKDNVNTGDEVQTTLKGEQVGGLASTPIGFSRPSKDEESRLLLTVELGERLSSRLSAQLRQLTVAEIANLALVLGTTSNRKNLKKAARLPILATLGISVAMRALEAKPTDVITMAKAYCLTEIKDASLFARLAAMALLTLPFFTRKQSIDLLKSMTELGFRHEGLLLKVAQTKLFTNGNAVYSAGSGSSSTQPAASSSSSISAEEILNVAFVYSNFELVVPQVCHLLESHWTVALDAFPPLLVPLEEENKDHVEQNIGAAEDGVDLDARSRHDTSADEQVERSGSAHVFTSCHVGSAPVSGSASPGRAAVEPSPDEDDEELRRGGDNEQQSKLYCQDGTSGATAWCEDTTADITTLISLSLSCSGSSADSSASESAVSLAQFLVSIHELELLEILPDVAAAVRARVKLETLILGGEQQVAFGEKSKSPDSLLWRFFVALGEAEGRQRRNRGAARMSCSRATHVHLHVPFGGTRTGRCGGAVAGYKAEPSTPSEKISPPQDKQRTSFDVAFEPSEDKAKMKEDSLKIMWRRYYPQEAAMNELLRESQKWRLQASTATTSPIFSSTKDDSTAPAQAADRYFLADGRSKNHPRLVHCSRSRRLSSLKNVTAPHHLPQMMRTLGLWSQHTPVDLQPLIAACVETLEEVATRTCAPSASSDGPVSTRFHFQKGTNSWSLVQLCHIAKGLRLLPPSISVRLRELVAPLLRNAVLSRAGVEDDDFSSGLEQDNVNDKISNVTEQTSAPARRPVSSMKNENLYWESLALSAVALQVEKEQVINQEVEDSSALRVEEICKRIARKSANVQLRRLLGVFSGNDDDDDKNSVLQEHEHESTCSSTASNRNSTARTSADVDESGRRNAAASPTSTSASVSSISSARPTTSSPSRKSRHLQNSQLHLLPPAMRDLVQSLQSRSFTVVFPDLLPHYVVIASSSSWTRGSPSTDGFISGLGADMEKKKMKNEKKDTDAVDHTHSSSQQEQAHQNMKHLILAPEHLIRGEVSYETQALCARYDVKGQIRYAGDMMFSSIYSRRSEKNKSAQHVGTSCQSKLLASTDRGLLQEGLC